MCIEKSASGNTTTHRVKHESLRAKIVFSFLSPFRTMKEEVGTWSNDLSTVVKVSLVIMNHCACIHE